jgi:hypothetical protein
VIFILGLLSAKGLARLRPSQRLQGIDCAPGRMILACLDSAVCLILYIFVLQPTKPQGKACP